MLRLLVVLSVLGCLGGQGVRGVSNHIPGSSRGITSGDELLASVVTGCLDGEDAVMTCVKKHTLSYLDHLTGEETRSLEGEKRSAVEDDSDRLDDLVLSRVQRFLNTHQFKVQLPEFFFQEAVLTFKPAEGLGEFDVSFPPAPVGESRAFSEEPLLTVSCSARDMMKEKMLLPLLLLLKIKLKALTPILVALVGMKALKALILSKLSILLVLGFLASQLFKKAGMMSMMPPMMMEPTPPPTAYGAPAPPTNMYGPPPTAPPPPVTMSSYEPVWEPSPGGPYKRNWNSHQVVYNAYANNNQASPPQPVVNST